MAFLQKTWKDRVAEYINRRILTKEDGTTELVSVERSEGTISQEGDAFSAANMNDLEQRIANEFSEQNKNLGEMNTQLDNINIQLQTIIETLERGIAPESLSGSVTLTVGGSASGGQYMVVFETPFSSVPTVTLSSSNFRIGASAGSITKAGFIIHYGNSSSNTHTSTITWTAVV